MRSWPDDVRDDTLALNAKRAERERLAGLPGGEPRSTSPSLHTLLVPRSR
jgi:hypothetical protein